MRIEETKRGILDQSYQWILDNPDFCHWRGSQQSQLLWIKGDPGKGKTMLLCGIIDELKKTMSTTDKLSFFFCQATDMRINSATAVLRGLLFLLADQLPQHISQAEGHSYDIQDLSDGVNAWYALKEAFESVLKELRSHTTYLVVDALDECTTDLPKLLEFFCQMLEVPTCAKLIVSSRNEAMGEHRLQLNNRITALSLETSRRMPSKYPAQSTYTLMRFCWD